MDKSGPDFYWQFLYAERWDFIKENKKVRKQKHAFNQESEQEKKQKKKERDKKTQKQSWSCVYEPI